MQPYPTFQNYSYNPFLTNYAQPIGQQQVPIPQNQMSNSMNVNLSGRWVNDFNEVSVNDVTMDRPSVFLKQDRSEIQVREWSPNGQITTTSYKVILEQNGSEVDKVSQSSKQSEFDMKTEVLEPIFDRLEELEQKIDKLSKPVSTSRTKKEGE